MALDGLQNEQICKNDRFLNLFSEKMWPSGTYYGLCAVREHAWGHNVALEDTLSL